jgi:hypothetical protein
MEPVFRTLEIAAKVAMRATGTRITFLGLENIPPTGGAVIAINHTSYIDFLPAALAAYYRKRRLRFMIKAEMQEVKFVGWLIKHTKTIDAALRESMTELLHAAQVDYPHPEGAYWVPRRLGGSAPTLAEAEVLEKAELAERARKRAEREAKSQR